MDTKELALAIALHMLFLACNTQQDHCTPSSCGNLNSIRSPFYLKTDTTNCSYSHSQLSCESNRTALYLGSMKYYVEEILYEKKVIRVVDSGLQQDNCSSLPLYSLPQDVFRQDDFMFLFLHDESHGESRDVSEAITFVNCSAPVDDPSYKSTSPCFNNSSQAYFYFLIGWRSVSDLHNSCTVVVRTYSLVKTAQNQSYLEIHHNLLRGFYMGWYMDLPSPSGMDLPSPCGRLLESPRCFILAVLGQISVIILKILPIVGRIMMERTAFGIFCLVAFLICKLYRKHFSMAETIEDFLCTYKSHMPTRYSYWDIWKMTDGFKEKLGKGGYGSVFKGKLPDGHLVAVKMLDKSKDDGQDFINEVATIGTIHHVNVVQLIGFCAVRSKRALIYDFMPNGSLEKYVFSHQGKSHSLNWEKMHEIALGIARGIEYLHRGCEMRILHFDIKPHNILLDDNFVPKVSDFGLAKLYPADESIVSTTFLRGTMGYIAPELFYRNAGGVSHKSDVYSFGMLLMDMAGRRNNMGALTENASNFYFPSWIYDQVDQGGDMGMSDVTEDEMEIAKKLIMVALWCIQMNPSDRPSMGKVVEMLEGSVELIHMPVKPFISSPQRVPDQNNDTGTNPTGSSATNSSRSSSQTSGQLGLDDDDAKHTNSVQSSTIYYSS
ncbi:LEAF RUST 10 DISEASE-RESISTANCE LOCUS RECEPTOR-LIKE PROTEIN KINASE-like 2.1 [Tasmannia lanceolata]|uniref:LEAF RUST 10 DISEASE-RESISTANCE LOCUS RECEPTOR-LIKE PROTEIN KINASE-like 2.1 n=1 Tax=Tasmannia lanceolata TaxID=3420 RepID=UPI004062BAFF